jgi:hypothetical protein
MIIITVSFINRLVNWYNNRLPPLIRHFILIPNDVDDVRLEVFTAVTK